MLNAFTRNLTTVSRNTSRICVRRTMASEKDTFKVLHDESKSMFYIPLEKGNALLEYNLEGDTIDMFHTEVPTAYRGQGIAKYLVKGALKYAGENVLKVRPSCSYVLKYVTDNPDPSINVVK